MQYKIYTDDDGWVTGYLASEGPKLEPDRGMDVTDEITDKIEECDCLYYDSINGLCCPRDDKIAWKVLRDRGYSGAECNGMISNVVRPMRNLSDIPSGTSLPNNYQPFVHPFLPVGDITEVPGLKIVPFTRDHLDAASALAIETGLHPAVCPGVSDDHPHECSPPESHAWMEIARRIDAPNRMAMALEYNGMPLQLEIFRLDGATATVGFTVHFTRERPREFWRRCEKPVFGALRAMGITKLFSYTRSDRPDWIQSLKDNYGATEVSTTPTNTILEFPLDVAFPDWPQRRTAGAGWTWPQGNLIVREATEAEIPDVLAMIDNTFPQVSVQKDRIKKIIDWWWNLDRAAILIGIEDGVLTHARMIRDRRDTVCSVSMVSRAGLGNGDFQEGMKAWQIEVGYTKASMMVPESLINTPEAQQHMSIALAKGGKIVAVHTKYRENFTEVEWDCV